MAAIRTIRHLGACGNELTKGARVKCLHGSPDLNLFVGQEYTVIDFSLVNATIKLKDRAGWWNANRFTLIAPPINSNEAKADRLIALINSKVRSPTKDEILEILRDKPNEIQAQKS